MSGPRRLAVFLSVAWLFAWLVFFVGTAGYGDIEWAAFAIIGVGPVGVLWGVAWVVAGFRKPRDVVERPTKG